MTIRQDYSIFTKLQSIISLVSGLMGKADGTHLSGIMIYPGPSLRPDHILSRHARNSATQEHRHSVLQCMQSPCIHALQTFKHNVFILYLQDRDGSDDQDMASDLRLPGGRPGEAGLPFPHLAHLSHLPGLPALEALNKQQKELLGSANIILPTSSPQGLLKAHSNLFPSPHHTPGAGGFTPMRPPSQVGHHDWLNWPLMCRNINFQPKIVNCFTANAKQSE